MSRHRLVRFSAVAALILGAATATAQRMLADFAGAWDVTVESPQGTVTSVLTLKQTADTVAGEFESQFGKSQVSGMVKGDSIKIAFTVDMQGQQIPIQAAGALTEKTKLSGTMEITGMASFPFSAVKKQ